MYVIWIPIHNVYPILNLFMIKFVRESNLVNYLSFYLLLVKMYNDLNDKTFPPNEIFDIMSSLYEQYYEKRQQGANEFISNFLKSFHKEINSIIYKENIFVNQKNTLLNKK